MEEERDYKKPSKKKICVKVYLNPENFQRYARLAERTGKRRGGLQLFTQKKNGFAGEMLANTDGISKFFKFAGIYWEENEARRMEEAADLARKEKDIAEQRRRLGLQ